MEVNGFYFFPSIGVDLVIFLITWGRLCRSRYGLTWYLRFHYIWLDLLLLTENEWNEYIWNPQSGLMCNNLDNLGEYVKFQFMITVLFAAIIYKCLSLIVDGDTFAQQLSSNSLCMTKGFAQLITKNLKHKSFSMFKIPEKALGLSILTSKLLNISIKKCNKIFTILRMFVTAEFNVFSLQPPESRQISLSVK